MRLFIDTRSYVNISEIGEKAVDEALQLRKEDFEDVLQYFSAKQANDETRRTSLFQTYRYILLLSLWKMSMKVNLLILNG